MEKEEAIKYVITNLCNRLYKAEKTNELDGKGVTPFNVDINYVKRYSLFSKGYKPRNEYIEINYSLPSNEKMTLYIEDNKNRFLLETNNYTKSKRENIYKFNEERINELIFIQFFVFVEVC